MSDTGTKTQQDDLDAPHGLGRVRRRRGVAAAALALVAAVVVAVVLATSGGGSDEASADSPSVSTATTEITRQDLVETDDEDGTLGYADTRDVVNHMTGVVTWIPAQGTVVKTNDTLYRVNGAPVILLNGTSPVYRTLSSASSRGHDIAQLERNLRRLGYDGAHAMTVDGYWDSGTTAAVERWQDDHGLDETGSIELGRVVFLPGARRIASVNATLGGSSTGGGSGSGSGADGGVAKTASADDEDVIEPSTQMVALTTSVSEALSHRSYSDITAHAAQADTTTTETITTETTPTETTPTETTPTETTPTETTPTETTPTGTTPTGTVPVAPTTTTPATTAPESSTPPATPSPSFGGGGPSASAAAGSGGGASNVADASGGATSTANAIMTTTSTRKIVTVALATTKSSLAIQGANVVVALPSGKSVSGHIASIGKVATAETNSDGSSTGTATIAITIRLNSKGSALDQAPVTVIFEQRRIKDVLAIPVTALLAQAGGKFAVELVEGTARRLVPVTPGVYTSGFVQITGDGLQAGQTVTDAAVR